MSVGTDELKHVIVLMMENRSFEHMLGGLKATHPLIDGIASNFTNPDNGGREIPSFIGSGGAVRLAQRL